MAQKMVYTLKIRWSGEDDDVFVFTSEKKALKFAMAYFYGAGALKQKKWTAHTMALSLDDIEMRGDGYYEIEHQEIR